MPRITSQSLRPQLCKRSSWAYTLALDPRSNATSVNPVEAQVRAGGMRPMSGFSFPKGTGQDFAGKVDYAFVGVGA